MAKLSRYTVYKYGELFCGPGGLALGTIKSKVKHKNSIYTIKHAWANDIDEDSCRTYIRNIALNNPDSVICKDVKELEIENLDPIDIFAYGFPCNDFSIVGKQSGLKGKYGPLYLYGVKILHHFNPIAFVAENVGGIASSDKKQAFRKIIKDLENAGKKYELTANLYKAEEYGIPQRRHRIMIVGVRKDLLLKFKVPAPTTKKNSVTAKYILENPPIPDNAFNNELTKQSKRVRERLKHIKPGENVWTANLPKHLKLNVKKAKLSQIYRRLHPGKPSYTITGSGGGGTHGYHYREPRALTNRERARIQTFPDNFFFCGGKESIRKQIGMAVPPRLSKIIFVALLKTLAGIKYKYIKESLYNH